MNSPSDTDQGKRARRKFLNTKWPSFGVVWLVWTLLVLWVLPDGQPNFGVYLSGTLIGAVAFKKIWLTLDTRRARR